MTILSVVLNDESCVILKCFCCLYICQALVHNCGLFKIMVFGFQELLYFMQKLLPSSIKDDDIASKTQRFLYSLLMKAALALEMLFFKM